jgi:putative hydrolase of the HAD superfamily
VAARCSREEVRGIVEEWIDQRPLGHVARYRYPGVNGLFDGIRESGRLIGVLSDYSAHAKLEALGLTADHVVSAVDRQVGILKPHPRGLQNLISAAGVTPEETVLIGDRVERDGMAARRAGARALIRSQEPLLGWLTFASFNDGLFAPFLKR